MKSRTAKTAKKRSSGVPAGKVRTNFLLLRETKERLERAKRQLNISETAMIESGLRLYFREQGIE
jgi:hypothetical protein